MCLKLCTIFLVFLVNQPGVNSDEQKIKDNLEDLTSQIEIIKTAHLNDISRIMIELSEIK